MPGLKKILIVEDEQLLSQALQAKLSHSGFEARVANNGVEALDTLVKEKFDIILLDIIMPKMDGITLFRTLRATEWGKSIPVIVLTNLSYIEKGQDLYLDKSSEILVKTDWTLDQVVEKVREKLSLPQTK